MTPAPPWGRRLPSTVTVEEGDGQVAQITHKQAAWHSRERGRCWRQKPWRIFKGTCTGLVRRGETHRFFYRHWVPRAGVTCGCEPPCVDAEDQLCSSRRAARALNHGAISSAATQSKIFLYVMCGVCACKTERGKGEEGEGGRARVWEDMCYGMHKGGVSALTFYFV